MICPLFYFYHDKLNCKCTQEESNCCAVLENCENKLARITYLADLEEEKNVKSN